MRKALVCIAMICMLCTVMALPTYAAPGMGESQEEMGDDLDYGLEEYERRNPNINPSISTSRVIGGLIDDICQVAIYIGAIQFAVGLVMYIMAYKDDHPESISRAARMMVVGAVLLGLKALLRTAKLIY